MKFSSSQLAYLVGDREARGNLRTLVKYIISLLTLITLYAVLFHIIKIRVEGEQHSWMTGFYWTLVVMTTIGFGDVTFSSDIGRLFTDFAAEGLILFKARAIFFNILLPIGAGTASRSTSP
mgnify:CR=1 FL=1